MSERRNICQTWTFAEGFDPTSTHIRIAGAPVVLPHTAVELPADYFDETCYQRTFTYQIHIPFEPGFADREVSLHFDGAMANAEVYAGGTLIASHPDGYTPFTARLTDHIGPDGVLVTVKIDGAENPDIPPFGGQIDYLTYAGIYREVWLRVADPVSIANVKIETPDCLSDHPRVEVTCFPDNPQDLIATGDWQADLLNTAGATVATARVPYVSGQSKLVLRDLPTPDLWSPDTPTLYTLRLTLTTEHGSDTRTIPFGFREADFRPEGFFLNGQKLQLTGLNRHQSVPYMGYALGRDAQKRDADILKFELGCNIVRTSHYPQHPAFLDHCDEIGLLVLEEIPGWQHLGGAKWQDEAVKNVRRMIARDWNHPSIILWGVRINESPDDTAFYTRTNALARELDPTRQTGGIRKHMHSPLLEDVYTFNDFILGNDELPGANHPRTALRDPREVTGLNHDTPYLITEYNGHMFPTKVMDQEQRQMEHVTRHLEVLNAAHGHNNIAGCIGWCMFDYNTHKDFGSGDRVCYHGVLTHYREPKFAASAYASQMDPTQNLVLEPVTFWSRGERNIGGTVPLMILTNCDVVRMELSNGTVKDIYPDHDTYAHLPHPPAMLRHSDIQGDEMGKWGLEWHDVEFVGLIDGAEVTRRKMAAGPVATTLQIAPDAATLNSDFQELRIAIRALDQVGNQLPFLDASVQIAIDGPAQLLGPTSPALRGGATAFWIRSQGRLGVINVTVKSERFPTHTVTIQAL